MSDEKPPAIDEFLDQLEGRRLERRDEFLRSISERRRAAERFRQTIEETVLPVVEELRRELERRKHTVKVVDNDDALRVTIATHEATTRHGSLRFSRVDDDHEKIRLEYEGIAQLRNRYQVELEQVDRDLATRAVLRLARGLLGD